MFSLLFVGFEIRQNTQAVKGATVQAISDQAFTFTMELAQDDDWTRIATFLNGGGTRAELSPEDRQRHAMWLMAGLRVMENRFQQVRLNLVDSAGLAVSGGTTQTGWYRSEHWLDWWRETGQATNWSPAFVEFMETEVLAIR